MEPSSQEEVDLNTLIAAGSVTIGHKVSSLNRLSLDNDPSDPSNPVYSVANNNPTNTRTVRVLDALASLCVSCERSQVVSIALQLNFKTDILSITIAENTSVSDKTVTYLTELWAMLARLSKLYAENRQQGPNPTKWKGYLLKSPEALETLVNLDILVGDLAKHIYEFTRPKYERRISKWWGPLCDFADKFRSLKGKKLNRLEGTFERMMLSFVNCIEKLGSETKNWLEIMLFMDGAALMAKKILKDKYKCERWATSLAGPDGDVFQLRRALEKLTSHHRYIHELIGFAHSPRLRRAFFMTTKVVRVPSPSGKKIPLPTSTAAWQSFLTSTCASTDIVEEDSWIERESERLHNKYKGHPSKPCGHSECSLVAYLETTHDLTPPLSYIGISKLCCIACTLWLTQFNARGGRQYYTRSTHSKWYFPWTPPKISGQPKLLGELTTKLKDAYVAYLEATKKLR